MSVVKSIAVEYKIKKKKIQEEKHLKCVRPSKRHVIRVGRRDIIWEAVGKDLSLADSPVHHGSSSPLVLKHYFK